MGRSIILVLAVLALAGCVAPGLSLSPAPAAAPSAPATGTFRVHYVNVGQGDGTIWELPDGSIAIYDCGPPVNDSTPNPMLVYLRDTLHRAPGSRLAALIASHGHLDHVGGCEEILSSYHFDVIDEAGYNGSDAPKSYQRFEAEIAAQHTRVRTLPEIAPGVSVDLPGVNATFLWPPGFTPGGWDSIAEASLVVRVRLGQTSFCFQGDIEAQQEIQLQGRCDVYLVGHHGSRYASSAAWLARMRPSVAVVSFGENTYGHPTSEALCRVQQAGATVYATHRAGTVVVESDGASVRVPRGQAETADYCAPGADFWST